MSTDIILDRAVLHAFFINNYYTHHRTTLTHEIIRNDLNANSFYATFLNSLDIVCLLLNVSRPSCSLEDFKEKFLNNIGTVHMIYNCWTHINDETNYREE